MKVILSLCLLLFFVGCQVKSGDNYILFKYKGFEVFYSDPISKVSFVDSRIFVDFSSKDRKILEELAIAINERATLDVYVGGQFYTSLLVDFTDGTLWEKKTVSLPLLPNAKDIFQKANIRVVE